MDFEGKIHSPKTACTQSQMLAGGKTNRRRGGSQQKARSSPSSPKLPGGNPSRAALFRLQRALRIHPAAPPTPHVEGPLLLC